MNVWAWEMGKPLKIERIGDMFQLLWLESVITEASLMTRNINLHSVLKNWMCFHCRSGGALPPQPKIGGVWGAAPPSHNCHHGSLTDDTKHQVALNTYELDVLSIAGLGGTAKIRWVWGAAPPIQIEEI